MAAPVSVQFRHSTRTSEKFMAVFTLFTLDNDRTRTVHFALQAQVITHNIAILCANNNT